MTTFATSNDSTTTLVAPPRPLDSGRVTSPFATFRMNLDGHSFKPALSTAEARRQAEKREDKLRAKLAKKEEKKAAKALKNSLPVKPPPMVTGLGGMSGMPSLGGSHFLPPPRPTGEEAEKKAEPKKDEKKNAKFRFFALPRVDEEEVKKTATVDTTSSVPRRSTSPPPSYAAARASVASAAFHPRSSLEESVEDMFRLSALGVGGGALAYRYNTAKKPTAITTTSKDADAMSILSDTTLTSNTAFGGGKLKSLFGKR